MKIISANSHKTVHIYLYLYIERTGNGFLHKYCIKQKTRVIHTASKMACYIYTLNSILPTHEILNYSCQVIIRRSFNNLTKEN